MSQILHGFPALAVFPTGMRVLLFGDTRLMLALADRG